MRPRSGFLSGRAHFFISEVLASTLYKIQAKKGASVVYHGRLKPCRDRVIPIWLRRRRAGEPGLSSQVLSPQSNPGATQVADRGMTFS